RNHHGRGGKLPYSSSPPATAASTRSSRVLSHPRTRLDRRAPFADAVDPRPHRAVCPVPLEASRTSGPAALAATVSVDAASVAPDSAPASLVAEEGRDPTGAGSGSPGERTPASG